MNRKKYIRPKAHEVRSERDSSETTRKQVREAHAVRVMKRIARRAQRARLAQKPFNYSSILYQFARLPSCHQIAAVLRNKRFFGLANM